MPRSVCVQHLYVLTLGVSIAQKSTYVRIQTVRGEMEKEKLGTDDLPADDVDFLTGSVSNPFRNHPPFQQPRKVDSCSCV
eukprot:1867434-Rhodomonas_salina.3